ncbi:MAG TPA: large conductance mechanosensitive channel protein MscL [Streptosporangiaceae bacterium]
MRGFRKFLLRGNLVDLAVAVVVGVAFNQVVQALIRDLITPLISAAGGQANFSGLIFSVNKSSFFYGDFINTALSFIVIAAVVYYMVVVPANRIAAVAERNAEATERPCPECLSDITLAATRCKYCTARVEPANVPHQPSSGGAHRLRPTNARPPTLHPRS